MTEPVLRLRGVTKRFGGVLANDAVNLSLNRGEVLALLGENGAGKTTLMNILFGHYLADSGTLEVADASGRLVALPGGSPQAAIRAGLGMVHQHFALAGNLTVFENVVLGTEALWRPAQRWRTARTRLKALMGRSGLAVPLDAPVRALSVGEQQRVEILKALYRQARILILDEPTAVLTPQESEALFATLRTLAAEGLSSIFISHKLKEVMAVSERVLVLRGGRLVLEAATEDVSGPALAEAMVGRPLPVTVREELPAGPPLLELRGVTVRGEGARPGLNDVSLTVHRHRIVGIAGVSGNGQAALSALLSGLARPIRGDVRLGGNPLPHTPAGMLRSGVGRIPEDRHRHGVVGEMSVWENLLLEGYREARFERFGWQRRKAARAHAAEIVRRYDVRGAGPDAPARLLSGGNMQKLILGRALAPEPQLIVASQPCRGLDVGASGYVHARLLEARAHGAGVLLISEDLDELMTLADEVAVLYQGRLSPVLSAERVSIRQLGLMMAGMSADEVLGAA